MKLIEGNPPEMHTDDDDDMVKRGNALPTRQISSLLDSDTVIIKSYINSSCCCILI